MGKSIVNKTNKNEIRVNIEAFKGRIINSLIQRLAYIGEECVRVARQRGNYNDITGNLRSSIGYTILLNGDEVIRGSSADYRKVTKSDKNGVDEGKKLLDKIKADYPQGLALIVCAGMNYAAYVENIHHRDVLTSAELVAESLAEKLLKGKYKKV
jgi:hypothetical protein